MDVRSSEMKSSAHMYLKSGSGSVIWWMPTKRLIVTKKNTNWIATASNQSRWKRVRRALTPKSTANHAAMRTTVATSWSASCPSFSQLLHSVLSPLERKEPFLQCKQSGPSALSRQ